MMRQLRRGVWLGVVGLAAACGWGECALWGQTAVTPPAATAPAAEDVACRYTPLLAAMKNPGVTGILITELQPLSAAEAAGLRVGDIITRYDGKPVETEEALKTAVAEAVAASANKVVASPVVVQVRRGGATVSRPIAAGGLGAATREVAAGVAAKGNPPGTDRGGFALEWAKVPVGDADTAAWTRQYEGDEFAGFERRVVTCEGMRWTVAVTSWIVDGGKVIEEQTSTVEFTAGDDKLTPAVQVAGLSWRGYGQEVKAERKGLIVGGTITTETEKIKQIERVEQATVLGAMPGSAIETVAAALPQVEGGGGGGGGGVVLPVALISEIDLRTRLGYALVTLGRKKVTVGGVERQLWGVRLLHWGREEMKLWLMTGGCLWRGNLRMGGVRSGWPGRRRHGWGWEEVLNA